MESYSKKIPKETKEINLQMNQESVKEVNKVDEKIESNESIKDEIKFDINEIINEKEEFEDNKINIEVEEDKKRNKSLLFNIKSKFLFKDILINYISGKKKLYLFKKSKSLQKHINITILDYQEKYLTNIFPLSKVNEFLKKRYLSNFYDSEKKQRNNLYNYFFNEIKFDKEVIETYMIKKLKEDFKKYGVFKSFCDDIDINNPFFDSLIKNDIIEEFQILIEESSFKNDTYLNDIQKAFEKLNNMNNIFPQIGFQLPFNCLDHINKLNINFKKIKKLLIIYPFVYSNENNVDDENEYFKKIFSFFQETNNLEHITMQIYNPIKAETLEMLNNFSNLKVLSLMNLDFKDDDIFKIKLPNLNKLSLSCCKNIALEENKIYNVETLILINSKVIKPKSLLSFPYLHFLVNSSTEIIPYLNLKNSKQLITLAANLSDISRVLDILPSLQNLTIEESKEVTNENEEKALNKILDNENLKFIKITTPLNDEIIKRINKTNLSITKIAFQNLNSILNNFLNKFANLNEFDFSKFDKTEDNIFEIKEDNSSKIKKIKLFGVPNGILYCHSFETIKSLNFTFMTKVKNIEKIIPFFSDKCTVIFKLLSEFSLTYSDINDEFLNKLKNNLDCAPYLFSFSLTFNFSNITENVYYDFIKKILSKRINNIVINNSINSSMTLTKEEIKKISPDFNFIYHDTIKISKF